MTMEMQLFLIHNTNIPLASPLCVQIPTPMLHRRANFSLRPARARPDSSVIDKNLHCATAQQDLEAETLTIPESLRYYGHRLSQALRWRSADTVVTLN